MSSRKSNSYQGQVDRGHRPNARLDHAKETHDHVFCRKLPLGEEVTDGRRHGAGHHPSRRGKPPAPQDDGGKCAMSLWLLTGPPAVPRTHRYEAAWRVFARACLRHLSEISRHNQKIHLCASWHLYAPELEAQRCRHGRA